MPTCSCLDTSRKWCSRPLHRPESMLTSQGTSASVTAPASLVTVVTIRAAAAHCAAEPRRLIVPKRISPRSTNFPRTPKLSSSTRASRAHCHPTNVLIFSSTHEGPLALQNCPFGWTFVHEGRASCTSGPRRNSAALAAASPASALRAHSPSALTLESGLPSCATRNPFFDTSLASWSPEVPRSNTFLNPRLHACAIQSLKPDSPLFSRSSHMAEYQG
mmetsp:Transcript_1105/g.3426  ORF Transcript_1105/g.3426 Transcript_1105/m.3426 type:complete len:218 (+) Transcript_1105:1965-2618(+)